jgi:hypothetical protein
MKFYLLILLYILPIPLLSQSVVITKVETEAYPTLNCEYIVLDENGRKIAPDKSEMSLTENGIPQTINDLSCDNNKSPVPVSVVLTLDNSTSMSDSVHNKPKFEIIKNAALKFVALLHPDTEIALTHFAAATYRDLAFTTDKNLVIQEIKNVPPKGGGTDITTAIIHPDGSIAATTGAKYRKIVLLMTDGKSGFLNKSQLVQPFIDSNVTLYTAAIYTEMDREIAEISNETGGIAFDNLQGEDKINSVFEALANLVSGLDVCKLTYISENCGRDRDIDLFYNNTYSDSARFTLTKEQLVEYYANPKQLELHKSSTQNYYSNIVSKKDTLVITDIFSLYSGFDIIEPVKTDFPIKLAIGKKLRVRIANPFGDSDISDVIRVESNSCEDQDIIVRYIPVENELSVEIPNGGEQYYVASSTDLSWDNQVSNSNYKVEYSDDAGFSWYEIVDNYNALDFPWERIPDTPTEEALLKVTEIKEDIDNIQTHSVGFIDSTNQSKIEKIIKYNDDKYIMLSKYRYKFEYRDLKLDTVGQEFEHKNLSRVVMAILDENLDVIKHKVFITEETDFLLTSNDEDVFLLLNNPFTLTYDTLDYTKVEPKHNVGLLLKIDSDLNLVNYKQFENEFQLVSGITYYSSLESSENKLHLYGSANRILEYDKNKIIDEPGSVRLNYLARFDLDLSLDKINYWDYTYDSLNFDFLGMQPRTDDNIILWGTGSGAGHLKLDTNFSRFLVVENNYNNQDLSLKNYLSFNNRVDFTAMDYLSFKDINYYSLQTNKATYYDKETKTIGGDDHFVRVIAYNDNYELLWERVFDEDAKDKNFALFESSAILMGGRTNERILFENDTIKKNQNTIFVTSLNPYSGKLNWTTYLGEPVYSGNLLAQGNKIIVTGNINKSLDFGNQHYSNIDVNTSYTKDFIWSLEYNKTNYDISDSLWSIRESSFDYIDTIDFGKVYINSRKDSLVLDFITRVTQGAVTVNNITIDDARYQTDFVGPVELQDKLDVRFQFNSDMAGSNISRGTIVTSIGNFYFYLLSEEIGDNTSFLWSFKEIDIDFGNLDISLFKTEGDWVVRNKNEAVIGIDSIAIVNDINNEYSFNVTTSPTHVFAFDTLLSEFTFTPKVAGPSNAEVHFYLDVRREPVIAKLRGNGISKDSVWLSVSIDTLSAFPERLTIIPIRFTLQDNPESLDLNRLEVDIEYNATLLLPFRFEDEGTVTNKVRQITIPIRNEEFASNLIEKRFLPTIGNAISTVIDIIDVRAYNSRGEEISSKKIETENGLFTLDGVCLTEGQYRLYEESAANRIDILEENGDFFVDYNLVEDGFTNLSIYDINGKLVTILAAKDLRKGEHRTEIDTENIAIGNYIVRLETPTQIISQIFTFTK